MSQANFPDVLGYITGGDRLNLNVAQVALATRPRVVRAGRPFEVIVLVQNASDSDVDLKLTLHLPQQDAKRQRDRFMSKTHRLMVGVKPAEVGYIVLPVATLADTAVAEGYKVAVDVEVHPLNKPSRIRTSDGGGTFNLETLDPTARERIESMKALSFSTTKLSGIGRSGIETSFSVMSGSLSKMTDFQPGWVSLAALRDFNDPRLLLHRYGDVIKVKTLPQFKREHVFEPLAARTAELFERVGYPLRESEAHAIAKVMTLLLEYAAPTQNAHPGVAAKHYNFEALLQRDPLARTDAPEMPHYIQTLLRLVDLDERAAQYPVKLLNEHLYYDLLRDAVDFGFVQVDAATGEDLGSAEDQVRYREKLVEALKTGINDGVIDFSGVYLPLLMCSVLVNEQLLNKGEDADTLPRLLQAALESRRGEVLEEDIPVFNLMVEFLDRTAHRVGYRNRENA